jgi:type IV secretory pathway VirB4 component
MLRVDRVIKPWKESAALNDHINLYGLWNETAFLTNGGDVGMVLSVPGVDYESLDPSEQEYAVKRLEAALKAFGPGFHVYQYLFKSNRPDIPFAKYDDPIVEAAIEQRRKFFEAKRDHLYSGRNLLARPSLFRSKSSIAFFDQWILEHERRTHG